MKRFPQFLWLVIIVAAFITLALIFRAPAPTKTSDYASWVQAIGSVAAILAAVALSVFQSRQALQARADDYLNQRQDRISGIAGLMQDVYWQLKMASNAASDPQPIRFMNYIVSEHDPDRLDRAVSALSDAPIHEMAQWKCVLAVIQMREVGLEAARELRRLKETPQPEMVWASEQFIRYFDRANECMGPVVRALARGQFEAPDFGEWKAHLD
nr:hypothetical protein [Brevundimonas diminuta]